MSLDQVVSRLNERVVSLGRWKATLFYASCAERFFPLYVAFAEAERWGDVNEVRSSLNLAWECLLVPEMEPRVFSQALERLLRETPHAADFDSVEMTFSQDVCALIDAALRSAWGRSDANSVPVEAAFEILRVAHCVELTGFLDFGSDPRALELEHQFMSGNLYTRELGCQEGDIDVLLKTSNIDRELVDGLRSRSERGRYDVKALLPTQAVGK